MFLQKLKINNFRNYESAQLELEPAINVFYGENAQGKTNLIEAVSVITLGRSFRTNREESFIRRGQNSFYLKGEFTGDTESLTIEIGTDRERSLVRMNGVEYKKRREVFGRVKVVIFSPDDLYLIKGGPEYRREYLDLYIGQIYPAYRKIYQRYYRALYQRNSALKRIKKGIKDSSLDAWTFQLVETGSLIVSLRIKVLKRLNFWINEYHKKISGGKEEIVCYYLGQGALFEEDDQEIIKENLLKAFQEKQRDEMQRGYTLVGPHRDDLSIIINGEGELRIFGSQGQQRTAALALKMAVVDLIESMEEKAPLLLLDDVFSEFDQQRKKSLLRILMKDKQTLITTANSRIREEFSPEIRFFKVEGGSIA